MYSSLPVQCQVRSWGTYEGMRRICATGGDGNETFGKMDVVLFGRDELRSRLAGPLANGVYGTNGKPYSAATLPMITHEGPVTFHMNGEEVELVPIPWAHTDGDTLVRIKKADIVMCGDFFRSSGYPNIALTEGGTLKGMLEGLNYLIGIAGPNTRIRGKGLKRIEWS